MAGAVLVIGGYLVFVGVVGSDMLVHPPPSRWCFTPGSEYGWEYEAINYDIADDERLLAEQRDARSCTGHGEPAGSAVVTQDGTRIAGWYIPAGGAEDGIGEDGPTVVLVHGHGNSKSDMLRYANVLHERYNVVILDLRNHGRSSRTHTTMGVYEQHEVRAILDWLEREKAPDRIGLLGVSMGGVTAANVAADDERVDALVLDSTHAALANTVEARLRNGGYPLTLAGYFAVIAGSWVRTGVFVHSADAVNAVSRLAERPLLILQGGRDREQGPENAEALLTAAQQAGVEAEARLCPEAGHAGVLAECPREYREWVLDFFERALAT